ncbi:hypothetical protein [Streptomyces sp. OK228]|uniref:hypothetical protein n=1 Tax=Streptomyces sp. OK228 TaxID=1882786 RepID=UPI000BD059DF|nr:hypothetical protein [Streptomyces sp. OK228]SOE25612.1 hypothetical protein SAMN05442782_2354 [Streptomyces sp. OK228]
MPLGDSYATLAQLHAYMKSSLDDVTTYDGILTDALASVSREIESHCHRQFNNTDTATDRIYDAGSIFTIRDQWSVTQWVEVDDFYDTAGLVVQSGTTTWTASDYKLYPRNGVVDGQPGWPYREIHAAGSLRFDTSYGVRFETPPDVTVTAKWGWASVPTPVKQACLILASETFQIKDAPFGVAGLDQFGVIRVRDNRMAESKLAPYVRDPIQVR